jgi:hypothetical protein
MLLALLVPALGACSLSQSSSAPPLPVLSASLPQMDAKAPAFLANGVVGLRMPPNPPGRNR